MAEVPGIQVSFSAKIDDLQRALGEIKRGLSEVAKEAEKASNAASSELTGAAGNITGAFANIASGIGASLGTLAKVSVASVAVGLAGIAGGAALAAENVRKIADEADELGKASQKIGIAVEALSELKYTADLSGVSFQGLQTAVTRLTKSMSEIAKGTENDAARAFELLDINVKNSDGTLRSANEVMADVAEKFSSFRDGAEKTALAIAVFGRAGAEMIPLLNAGAEGLQKSNIEAREFGAVMSGPLAKASENFNDNMSRIQYAVKGVFIAIANELVPIISDWSDGLVKSIKEMQLFERTGEIMRSVINSITEAVIWASGRLEGFSAIVERIGQGAKELASGEFSKGWETLKSGSDAYAEAVKRASDRIDEFRKKSDDLAAYGTLANVPSALPDARKAAPTLERKETPSIENDESLKYEQERILARLNIIREGFLTEEQYLVEQLEKNQNLIDEAFQKKLITDQEHKKYMEQLEKEHQDELNSIRQAGTLRGLTLLAKGGKDMANAFAGNSKKLAATAKAFGAFEALINAYRAFNQTLADATLPWYAKIGAAASVLAAGLQTVSAIRSISDTGKGGGAVSGGSASSGGTPAGASTPDSRMGQSVYINLQGQSFGRDQVRDLVKQISDFQKDGGQVVFA